jgi:hypothetical protein
MIYLCNSSSLAHVPATAFSASPGAGKIPGFAGRMKAVPPVMMMYFAGSTISPAWPWPLLPHPSVVRMVAAIAMSSLSSNVAPWSLSWPWIVVTVSFFRFRVPLWGLL